LRRIYDSSAKVTLLDRLLFNKKEAYPSRDLYTPWDLAAEGQLYIGRAVVKQKFYNPMLPVVCGGFPYFFH